MAKHFLMKIQALDHPLVSMDNATLRMTLMATKAPDGKPLLLSMDCSWGSQGFSVVFPAKYRIKAQEFVEYLLKYLQHEHGEAVFHWFMPDAITKAREMGWDNKLQQPISQDGIDLKADLKLLDFEWCIRPEPPVKLDLTKENPVDMDNLSLPSFKTINTPGTVAHPAGPTTQLKSPTLPKSTLPSTLLATVHLDDLTADSTIASRLSSLETNWLLILQHLDKLAEMGVINHPMGNGTTSSLPVSSTLGPALADPGPRV